MLTIRTACLDGVTRLSLGTVGIYTPTALTTSTRHGRVARCLYSACRFRLFEQLARVVNGRYTDGRRGGAIGCLTRWDLALRYRTFNRAPAPTRTFSAKRHNERRRYVTYMLYRWWQLIADCSGNTVAKQYGAGFLPLLPYPPALSSCPLPLLSGLLLLPSSPLPLHMRRQRARRITWWRPAAAASAAALAPRALASQ